MEALTEAALIDVVLPGKCEETVRSEGDAGGTAVEPSGEGEALATMALAK